MSGIPSRFKSEMESHMSAEVKREREGDEGANVTPRSRRRKLARKGRMEGIKIEDVAVKEEVKIVKEEMDLVKVEGVIVKTKVDTVKHGGIPSKVEEDMIVKVEEDVGVPEATIKVEGGPIEAVADCIDVEDDEFWEREERRARNAIAAFEIKDLLRRNLEGSGAGRRTTAKQRACE
jgi:hypothetical protein